MTKSALALDAWLNAYAPLSKKVEPMPEVAIVECHSCGEYIILGECCDCSTAGGDEYWDRVDEAWSDYKDSDGLNGFPSRG